MREIAALDISLAACNPIANIRWKFVELDSRMVATCSLVTACNYQIFNIYYPGLRHFALG
jgi:hypothetical protein